MIKIYTKKTCSYCYMAKKLLNSKGLEYTETDVTFNREKFNEMTKLAEGRRTVPQIFIHNKPIGGFTELSDLSHKGELDKLLNV